MTSKLIQDGQEKTFAIVFDAGEEVVGGFACVRPTLEVVVVEASQHMRRTVRGEFGLALLDLSS